MEKYQVQLNQLEQGIEENKREIVRIGETLKETEQTLMTGRDAETGKVLGYLEIKEEAWNHTDLKMRKEMYQYQIDKQEEEMETLRDYIQHITHGSSQ
jgi:hypothetical protein